MDQVGEKGKDGNQGDIGRPWPGWQVASHGAHHKGPRAGGWGTMLPGSVGGVEGASASPVLQGGDHTKALLGLGLGLGGWDYYREQEMVLTVTCLP